MARTRFELASPRRQSSTRNLGLYPVKLPSHVRPEPSDPKRKQRAAQCQVRQPGGWDQSPSPFAFSAISVRERVSTGLGQPSRQFPQEPKFACPNQEKAVRSATQRESRSAERAVHSSSPGLLTNQYFHPSKLGGFPDFVLAHPPAAADGLLYLLPSTIQDASSIKP